MRRTKLMIMTVACSLCFCSAVYAQDRYGEPRPRYGDPIVRKITYEAIKREPKLGAKIPSDYPKPTDSIVGESSERYSIYHVLFKDTKYSVRADTKGRIRYIMSTDSRFKTAEGVTEGMTFREVRPLSKGEMVREHYGFYLRLGSGWKAAFRTKAEGDLLYDEKVSWLFKEN